MGIRVVYMGTPEFAVAPLEALLANGIEVAAVVTAPDKPAGRGMQLQASAVKQCALRRDIPVLQPEKLKHPDFLNALQALNADIFVVVAFRMLPYDVFSMPALGTFNLHGSLLPQYRGAAPIHWAVINGEKETGVTTFFIDEQIDTGQVIAYAKTPIGENETTGEVHDRLMSLGADLVVQTVLKIASGTCTSIPQAVLTKEEHLKEAPKLVKSHCEIDWSASTERVHNFIRGLSPFPCAFTHFVKQDQATLLKIYRSAKVEASVVCEKLSGVSEKPGSLHTDGNRLWVRLKDGFLEILELQLQGKKRMQAADFLRGFRPDTSDHLA